MSYDYYYYDDYLDDYGDEPQNSISTASQVLRSNTVSFITDFIQDYALTLNWNINDSLEQIRFIQLQQYSSEYQEVETLFNRSNKKWFRIMQIERIQNPYLLAAFLLKKEEMTRRTGQQEINKLFHGTKETSVMGICTDNLNWRFFGTNKGHKFGQGISFTSIAYYATHYMDVTCDDQIMFLVHVLVGKKTVGISSMKLPPEGFDTTIKYNGDVIVKYEDNEFYPAYKIVYKCIKPDEISGYEMGINKQSPIRSQTAIPSMDLVNTDYNYNMYHTYNYDGYYDYYYYNNYSSDNVYYRNYNNDEGKKNKSNFYKYVMIVITPITIGVRKWFNLRMFR